ncbi:MAG: FAD-binding oxidoreductase [bacterium]|nr:FAD-binding oxidoreductase [bacterium]
MSKIAHYLQEHLLGEVTASPDVRRYFAQDGSVLRQAPTVVVYPRNESDVRKSVRFAWQLAERGKILPVTARGGGTSTTGSAIGSGIILTFAAHMDRVLELNTKKRLMIIQPGMAYNTLEQMLYSHGLFLPPCPPLSSYATIGGGIATDAIGKKSLKYGATSQYVKSLRVILSNGEVIETGPLSKKELNHKLGLQTLEGEIYRSLDKMLEENAQFIERGRGAIKARFSSSGYNLFDVKKKNQFDLTPLLIGSEGTLAITTEATLDIKDYNPRTSQALISLDELGDLYEVMPPLLDLKPSVLDMFNRAVIEQIKKLNPNQLNDVALREEAPIHLFVEFDEVKESDQKKSIAALQKIVDKAGAWCEIAEDSESKERLSKLQGSISTILVQSQGQARSVPVAEDICVPVDKLVEFINKAETAYSEVGLPPAIWGHAGSGVVRMQPVLDLGQTGDRQKLFKLQDVLYSAAIQLGGSISAGNGDGRMRAPYISLQYGEELYQMMLQVKTVFDPHGILNPGVKTASNNEVRALMRTSYDSGRFADHLPRS